MFHRGELGRKTARHLHISEAIRARNLDVSSEEAFAAAVRSWRTLPEDEKKRLARQAASDNVVTKRLKEDQLCRVSADDGDPEAYPSLWNIAEGCKYPLPASSIQAILDTKGGLRAKAEEWSPLGRRCLPDPSFPDVVQYVVPLKDGLLVPPPPPSRRANLLSLLQSPPAPRPKPRSGVSVGELAGFEGVMTDSLDDLVGGDGAAFRSRW